MTDRFVAAGDLDGARGLAEDGSKAYVKVDGTTMDFDANGNLISKVGATFTSTVTGGHAIGDIEVNGTTSTVYETIVQLVKDQPTCSFTLTKEDGTTVNVPASLFLSADAANSLIVGADGGLYFSAQAIINDDQVLTGDNTGTVQVTLTPTTVTDPANPNNTQVNYVIKSDVKLSASVPSGLTNILKQDSATNTLYVDPADAQAGMSLTVNKSTPSLELNDATGNLINDLPMVMVTNLDGTIKRAWFDVTP